MMPIRIIYGVGKHFPSRAPEWALASVLTLWGVRLLLSDTIFDGPSFVVLNRFLDEQQWGAACLIVGLFRLTALTVNGTLYDIVELRENPALWARVLVAYSRYSPHVRSFMALLSCFFWATIAIGIVAAGALGTGVCVYPVLFLLDVSCASRAAIDADKVHRGVPSSG